MARTKKSFSPPDWFALGNYRDAAKMDAADWYVNLLLRGKMHREPDNFFLHHLRQHPLPRRQTPAGDELVMLLGLLPAEGFDPDIRRVLTNNEPRASVRRLRTEELYFFEKRLPEPIREFGRVYDPGKHNAADAPPGFQGPIDRAFPRRMLSSFVQIDLSKPENLIVEDLLGFVAEQRKELAEIPVPQPHAKALLELRGRRSLKMSTLARLQVLAYIDLEQWRKESEQSITQAAYADALDVSWEDLRETRKYAALLLNDLAMRAWLTGDARAAIRHHRNKSGKTLSKSP